MKKQELSLGFNAANLPGGSSTLATPLLQSQTPSPSTEASQIEAQKQDKHGHYAAGPGWTFYLFYSIFASVLGSSFMYGYNSGVINPPYNVMSRFVNASFYRQHRILLTSAQLDTQWSLVVSLFVVGGIIGSCWFPEAMANRFGRTRSLLYISAIGSMGGILSFFAPETGSYLPLMIGRTLCGFHAGIAMVVIPALLVELPPIRLRGACGSLNELTVVIGFAVSELVGLHFILGTEQLWQALFILAAIIYAIQGVLLLFAAESPRWLVDKNRDKAALAVLQKLRGRSDGSAILAEFEETKAISLAEAAINRVSIMDFTRSRQLWWPLILSVNLHFTQQFTGVAAIMYYASDVMMRAGLDEDTAKLANFGISFVDIFATLLSTSIVDRVGRRVLILLGLAGMSLSHVFLTVVLVLNQYYACIVGVAVIFFTSSMGPAPIPWFMTAEMFTQAARPLALSVCLVVNWLCNLAVGLLFPHMINHLGNYAFLPFGIVAFLEMIFLYAFLPETSGIPVEDVVAKFAPGLPFLQIKPCSLFSFAIKKTRQQSRRRTSTETTVITTPYGQSSFSSSDKSLQVDGENNNNNNDNILSTVQLGLPGSDK